MVKGSFIDDSVLLDDIKDVIENIINGIINSDCYEYEDFVETLLHLHSDLHAYICQEYMNVLIEAAEEISKKIDYLWK